MQINKTRFITALLLCAGLQALAQKPLTIIRGTVDKERASKVQLYQVVEGQMTEYASTTLDAGNNYAFALPEVKEGFYYVTDNAGKSLPARLYLKSGDAVKLNILANGTELSGTSPENKVLNEWQQMYNGIAVPAFLFWSDRTEYPEFFTHLTAFIPKAAAFKKQVNTPNKRFNELLKMVIDSDVEYAAIQFIYTPRSVHPTKDQYPAYYNTILQPKKFCDTRILQLGDGLDRMDRYSLYCNMNSGTEIAREERLSYSLNLFCNDTLKGIYLVQGLGRYQSLEKLRDDVAPFKKYLLTDSSKAKYLRRESALASYAKGEKAYNFAYPDVNGDTVSLASLKGKVVLVDTWATWCMPCRAEIPHLQKLEEELRNKAIAFVSLSCDEAKDEAKWKAFVEKEKLTGIQLYAKGFSEFTKYYKINAIPRFLIFDKEGKIVTVDAPRPSDPALKTLLLQLAEG